MLFGIAFYFLPSSLEPVSVGEELKARNRATGIASILFLSQGIRQSGLSKTDIH
jgi:hypothetical protein